MDVIWVVFADVFSMIDLNDEYLSKWLLFFGRKKTVGFF